jgi:antitoxin MazE
MKPIPITIRKIGNSQGVVIPKPLLAQVGFEGEAEITVEGGALVLRKPTHPARAGWAAAAQKIAELSDEALVMGEFGNEGDAELAW